MWTQLRMDYLKGGVMAAQIGLARRIAALANGVIRFCQWAEEKSRRVESAMGKDQVTVVEWGFRGLYEEKKC